jgi:tight adherence protein C
MEPYLVGFGCTALVLGGMAFYMRLAGRPSAAAARASQRLRELKQGNESVTESVVPGENKGLLNIASKVGEWVSPTADQQSSSLQEKLALAGYKRPAAVRQFLGLQLLAILVLAGVGAAAAVLMSQPWPRLLLYSSIGGATGMILSSYALSKRVAKRKAAINLALPDALDILVLAVEGGASLNAGISWVTEEIKDIHPVLGAEMAIVEGEIQLGFSPAEALRGLADRCGNTDIRELSAAILQSERYGVGVAKVMRNFAESARQDRQLRMEEAAQKAAVKIVFPMLLFIFPAIFIVLLGPAAMEMSKLFAKP